MCTRTIYSIILQILHLLYELLQTVLNGYLYLTNLWCKGHDIENLKIEIKNLKKKPRHVVVMLGNEEPSYKDLANIVLWSVVAGIPIISFYDHNGVLKNNKQKLHEEIDKLNIKYENNICRKIQNGHKNGTSLAPIHVNVLSMIDGQKTVAEVTKSFVINAKNVDIGIDYVDEQLRKRVGDFPDPELALYCGPICSTYGMLPWQIRLTEFINIVSHHRIPLKNFKLALKRYDKIDQRCGK